MNSSLSMDGIYITHFDLVGYLAIAFSLFAFLARDKQKMRLNGMVSTLFFGISIYFYSGINGLFVSLISFFVKLLSFKIEEKKLEILKFLSPVIAFLFFLFFNKEGWVGIFPAVSLIFIIVADLQTELIKMKLWYYGSAFSWLIYGILLNSIPAILFDILGIFALTYSIGEIKKEKILFDLREQMELLQKKLDGGGEFYEKNFTTHMERKLKDLISFNNEIKKLNPILVLTKKEG